MSVQGSREWLLERKGNVTASRFADCMTSPQNATDRKNGLLSATAQTYLLELLAEHLTGEPTEEIKAKALDWGKLWEPVARESYRKFVAQPVEEVGFMKHPTEPLIGASPDSLVGDEGMAEIKCPLTGKQHLRVMMNGQVPEEHTEQIQGGMWVTGRQWCDFVSYHDRFPPPLRLKVIRVYSNPHWQHTIANAVIPFRNRLVKELSKLLAIWDAKK